MATGVSTAIVGVTGYEGAVLARLVAAHPHLHLIEATARSDAGRCLGDALPSLAGTPVAQLPLTESVREAEFVFIAVPHGPASQIAAQCLREGRRVVDLSADFRLHDPDLYATWYGHEHLAPDLLPNAVYGLPEWRRDQLRQATLVANPGCFPTTALLALGPVVAEQLVQPDVIIDAKTGITGGGRSPSRRFLFVENHDSITAYNVNGHRHTPEMVQEFAAQAGDGAAPSVTFIPHLVPMNRGILATCYATLRQDVTAAQVREAYAKHYANEPFIILSDRPPETAWVRGSNRCMIFLAIDENRRRLVVVAAIDNLMKGGAGQAVQNANLMCGFAETAGIDAVGVWP
jgi:N-acetyl-gamma-glutamyl-phosphate reductase